MYNIAHARNVQYYAFNIFNAHNDGDIEYGEIKRLTRRNCINAIIVYHYWTSIILRTLLFVSYSSSFHGGYNR